jgi:hypothetical protein
MKNKNYLVARIQIDNVSIRLVCRKSNSGKYQWFAKNGKLKNIGIPAANSLYNARSSLVTTMPPDRYNMSAKWL